MLTILLRRSGCDDIRFFKDEEEFKEWAERQLDVQPDTQIIEIIEAS